MGPASWPGRGGHAVQENLGPGAASPGGGCRFACRCTPPFNGAPRWPARFLAFPFQAGKVCVRPEGAALWLRRAVAARPGAQEPGTQEPGAQEPRGARPRGARLLRRGDARAQPSRTRAFGCVRMRMRPPPAKPAAHAQPGNLVLSVVSTQVGHRCSARDCPCPAHLGLSTWPSAPGPAQVPPTHTCSYLHKDLLEEDT